MARHPEIMPQIVDDDGQPARFPQFGLGHRRRMIRFVQTPGDVFENVFVDFFVIIFEFDRIRLAQVDHRFPWVGGRIWRLDGDGWPGLRLLVNGSCGSAESFGSVRSGRRGDEFGNDRQGVGCCPGRIGSGRRRHRHRSGGLRHPMHQCQSGSVRFL